MDDSFSFVVSTQGFDVSDCFPVPVVPSPPIVDLLDSPGKNFDAPAGPVALEDPPLATEIFSDGDILPTDDSIFN